MLCRGFKWCLGRGCHACKYNWHNYHFSKTEKTNKQFFVYENFHCHHTKPKQHRCIIIRQSWQTRAHGFKFIKVFAGPHRLLSISKGWCRWCMGGTALAYDRERDRESASNFCWFRFAFKECASTSSSTSSLIMLGTSYCQTITDLHDGGWWADGARQSNRKWFKFFVKSTSIIDKKWWIEQRNISRK